MSVQNNRSIRGLLVATVLVAGGFLLNYGLAERSERADAIERDVAKAVRENFQEYASGLKSIPPDHMRQFEAEVDNRIREAGMWPHSLGQANPVGRWLAFNERLAWQRKFVEETDRLESDAMEKCIPVFGDQCRIIIGSWICVERGRCSEEIAESIIEQIYNSDILRTGMYQYCESALAEY